MPVTPTTTIKSDIGSAVGGVITFQGGTGATVNQSGQTFTIGASPSIGGPITGGTAMRVLFVGATATIAEDADFTFNTTGNVLSVTNGQFNVDNLRLDGNTISSTDTNGNVVISPNGNGAFNLTTETQNWLGTQMIIKDVLNREIITATGTLMTIKTLNLEVEQIIQCDSSIEVQDTVDLNKLNGSQLRVLPDGGTIGGAIKSFTLASALTVSNAANSYQFVQANNTFTYTTGPTLGIPPIFFQFIPTITMNTTNMSFGGSSVYYNQCSFVADGIVVTMAGDSFPSFYDSPTFAIANAGSYNATAAYRAFHSNFTINSGTFNRRTGFAVQNGGGAGTLNEQRGFFCGALTKGGVANNPLYINAPDTADASGSLIDGNITLFALAGSYGGGSRVLFVHNATTVPSTNPTAGGILYAEGGALKWRGSGGTVTTIAGA